jgi:tetratricopeptide (TPR) repeat protein
MRLVHLLLGGTALAASTAAPAADQLKFGKPPEWVVPQTLPTTEGKRTDAPFTVLLMDQQVRFEPGKTVTYGEAAIKIETPQGLAAGNLSLPWDPATDTVTVNKLQIRRGSQIIDVLASGQTFTTMRRESNLELAMLDGVLTANIQPEGLQQGDVIDFATTTEHVDPVTGNHVEAKFGTWGPSPVRVGHLRLDWPAGMPMSVQAKGFSIGQSERGGRKLVELSERNVEPPIPPKGAPPRFSVTRLGEATDFASWAEVAALMAPLYRKAEAIPTAGPLHDEVEKIRAGATDPKLRATRALQLVQDRVRYVALLMGQGGFVPANAEATWSRRFGDCKAKTALLLGTLHALGIEAEPILVQSALGDAIAERLPLLGYFDHVLVQAHLGGKTYYLDGTRTGDSDLDEIKVPDFGWALPLTSGARLVQLLPPPLQHPATDTQLVIDASKGVRALADVTVEQTIRGDMAILFNNGIGSLTDAQRLEFFNTYWKKDYNFVGPGPTVTSYDAAKKIYRLSMHGTGKLDWNTHYFHLPDSTLGYAPDFDRPAGPFHDAPLAVAYPAFTHNLTKVRFPSGFFGARPIGSTPTTNETLAGVEYRMTVTRVSDPAADTLTLETSQRSLVPEVPYKDALAAASRLRELSDADVAVPLPSSYRPTTADMAALTEAQPSSVSEFLTRGNVFLNRGKLDQAVADFNEALKLEPANVWALADRAMAQTWLRHFDDAEKDLKAAEARDQDNPVVLRSRALIAELKNECEKAVDFYTRSLVKDPGNNFAVGHRAICEANLSKTDQALADSALALKADPSWIDLRVLRANIFVRRGNNAEVAREAELLTSENPKSDYAHVAAGKIYAKLARTNEAMKAFDAALAIAPEAYVYLNRAQARPFTDRIGRLADLDAALKLDPKNLDALAEKAEQLAVDGDLKSAKETYDRLVKTAPDVRYYKTRLGVMAFKTGDTEQARKLFEQLRTEAKSANDYNSLCWSKATGGILLESALEDCREALKREPDAGAYLDSLALVELRLGNLDAAIADYTRAISKNTGAASYMGRALAYARKGAKALSTADLRQALQLDPDEQTRFAEFGLKLDQSPPAGAVH